MIGNDVVDLELAHHESDWQRQGFLEKIFTESEQDMIFNHEIPEIMVWVLWSKKESAYKIYNRLTSHRAYIPRFFECSEMELRSNCIFGKVNCEGLIFFTKTFVTKDCIRTIAVKEFKDLKRVKVLDKNIRIKKSNGIPDFFDKLSNEFRPVSVSHHGRFESIVTI